LKTAVSRLRGDVERLIRAAEMRGGWLLLARIGVLKALHRGMVREFKSDRKEAHWAKPEAETGRIARTNGLGKAPNSPLGGLPFLEGR
jgi:hypothetical protein